MNPPLFRIAFNGLRYRIDKRCWQGHLWWRRQVWSPMGEGRGRSGLWYCDYYETLQAAQRALEKILRDEAKESADWSTLRCYTTANLDKGVLPDNPDNWAVSTAPHQAESLN